MFAFCAFALVACDPEPEPQPQPNQDAKLELISEAAVEFDAKGGEGTIEYKLTNPVEGTELTAEADAAWITNVTVADKVTYFVEANETEEAREATITLTYGALTKSVAVKQAAKANEDAPQPEPAYDFEFEAGAINGAYYGTEYSTAYNYFIMLSESGTAHANDTSVTHYRFDIYSNTGCDTDPATLPLGTYTVDPDDTYAANTCSLSYSAHVIAENGTFSGVNYFESGTITITENRIEAKIVDMKGQTHHVVYEGPLQIGFEQIELGDVEFNYDAAIIVAENYGDLYEVGCDNWYIYAYEQYDEETYEPSGHHFGIELFIDTAAENLTGVYTLAEDEMEDYSGTFLAGYDEGDYLYGCWYIDYDSYVGVPMVDGTITVELGEDNKYTFTFDCIDNDGNTITGTAAGFVDVLDMREEGASLSSAKLSPKRVLSTKKAALR